METENKINILFAATSDYLKYATVTALSIKDKLPQNTRLCIHFLYADIVKEISDFNRQICFEFANSTFEQNGIDIEYYDVEKYMNVFDGQSPGMWEKEVSMTHYMYLLAPIILKNIDKVIYLDTDTIVNTDLTEIYNIDMKDYLLAMGAPRGMEEMGDDVSNSGVVVLNLNKWREENTLEELLDFGKDLPKERFCDQYLLYQYFTKGHPDRLMLLPKEYNIFPQLFPEMPINDIKIFHYTGWKHIYPWKDRNNESRAGFLWWKYAKKTAFYEHFILSNIPSKNQLNNYIQKEFDKKVEGLKKKFINSIFSVRNELINDKIYKVITVFGIKIKFKRGKYAES